MRFFIRLHRLTHSLILLPGVLSVLAFLMSIGFYCWDPVPCLLVSHFIVSWIPVKLSDYISFFLKLKLKFKFFKLLYPKPLVFPLLLALPGFNYSYLAHQFIPYLYCYYSQVKLHSLYPFINSFDFALFNSHFMILCLTQFTPIRFYYLIDSLYSHLFYKDCSMFPFNN